MTSLSEERERLLRRLHSAAGTLPLGAFFLLHLWINARVSRGHAAYDAVTAQFQRVPALFAIELLVVFAPLTFHAAAGVFLMAKGAKREARGAGDKPWATVMQRLTGALTLGFLVVHLFQFRLQVATDQIRPADFFPLLCDRLSATNGLGIPSSAVIYLAGLAAASYHFANGILGSCFTFGFVRSGPSARLVSACCAGVGLATFLVGANTVISLSTGAPWPGRGEPPTREDVGVIRIGQRTPN
jgi:succinate dehydrogenase / fumarate reductase cytochrome b subunit